MNAMRTLDRKEGTQASRGPVIKIRPMENGIMMSDVEYRLDKLQFTSDGRSIIYNTVTDVPLFLATRDP